MSTWLTRTGESGWLSLEQATDNSRLDRRSRGAHHRLCCVYTQLCWAAEQSHTQGGLEDGQVEGQRGLGQDRTIAVEKRECFHGLCPSEEILAQRFSQRRGSMPSLDSKSET